MTLRPPPFRAGGGSISQGADVTGWRGLGTFWIAVLLLLCGGAVVLQTLGPPLPPVLPSLPQGRVAAVQAAPLPLASQQRQAPPADRPGRDTPGPIADPDPALLEPGPSGAAAMLPRIAEDGRRPSQFYAAGFDHSSRLPRIGIMLAGIGLDQAQSEKAIQDLPGGITLAISPYATRLAGLLVSARLAEHEYLLSIPMEPQGFPSNDPGSRALMTGLSATDNLDRLRSVLAEIEGYVGVTNALGTMRGERFSGMATLMQPVLAEVARRGLLYVDARLPDAHGMARQRDVWSCGVDMVLDDPPGDIDLKLAQLEQMAHDNGVALGLASAPTPVVLEHLAAWAKGLRERGLALAPVSALVGPPTVVAVSAQ